MKETSQRVGNDQPFADFMKKTHPTILFSQRNPTIKNTHARISNSN